MLTLLVITVALCFHGNAAFFLETSSRNVTQTLSSTNGGQFGSWGRAEFCPQGQWAVGYDMKIEKYQFTGDDTALNSIALICSDMDGAHFGSHAITSTEGPFGDWKGRVTCNQRPSKPMFLSAFSLQVETPQGSLDDNGATWVKFQCEDMYGTTQMEELNKDPGKNSFGDFGPYSSSCAAGSAICGLKTKVEGNQGSNDDTTLNDVQFYCCNARDPGH
ncbi:vitelline membrane outer layer protein 1-like [Mya arenaria]|uniref:vitelline membrane outer layer protein 1-like n=1 Tax=Mya arenaria TaxID=6604 RepID=UPI0022E58AB5|nr:vitelline membrane outer layer protein 1-like [Mya arenaria]